MLQESILPMQLQYFAEGNEGGDSGAAGGGQGGTPPAPKNVTADQFNSLTATVNGINDTISKLNEFMSQSSASAPASSNAPANSSAQGGSSAADSAGGMSDEWQKKFDEQQKIIDSLTTTQSATSAATTQASLTAYAQSVAKASGIDLGSVVDRMVGKNEEETKSNVEAFAQTIKKNTTTDNGFHLADTNGTINSPNDYMKGFLQRKFGKNK